MPEQHPVTSLPTLRLMMCHLMWCGMCRVVCHVMCRVMCQVMCHVMCNMVQILCHMMCCVTSCAVHLRTITMAKNILQALPNGLYAETIMCTAGRQPTTIKYTARDMIRTKGLCDFISIIGAAYSQCACESGILRVPFMNIGHTKAARCQCETWKCGCVLQTQAQVQF